MFNNAPGGLNMTTTILRLPEVKSRTGLARSTIYLRVAENAFPAPISLGGRSVGWLESEIDEWVEHCIMTSRPSGTEVSSDE